MTDKKLLFPLCVFPVGIQALIADLLLDPTYSHNYLCAALFFVVSIAIGNSRALSFNGKYSKAILFMGFLGSTGAAKTPNIMAALAPILNVDTYYLTRYKAELKNWQNAPIDSRGDKPRPKQLRVQDFTLEAILQLLSWRTHGICVFVDELKGWLSSFNQYRGRGSDQEQWLSIFSGVPVVVNRKTQDEVPFIPNPFVGVIGGIQPKVLPKLFGGDKMDNGFFHRLLFVPDSNEGEPLLWKPGDLPSSAGEKWEQFIKKILEMSGYFSEQEKVDPTVYCFSDDAIEHICIWQNEIEKKNTEEPEYMTEIFRKIQTYCLRFALVIHTMREAAGDIDTSTTIGDDTVTRAIVLAEFFYETAQVAYEMVLADNTPNDFFRLLNGLNTFFTTDQAIAVGERMGISRAKVFRLLGVKPDDPFLRKLKHGKYEKLE
ncbi:MAG: DUF3987 domain-containing protein [Bacteroidales bacterium]|nr:DUF3987 domain-containing protein [Bacteroidales bacterium]